MPKINKIEKCYANLTDEEIYKLSHEQWKALPEEKRTSAESIMLSEDLFLLRKMYQEIRKNHSEI